MKNLGPILIGIVYLAVLFLLVRPRSQGPSLIKSVADGLVGLIGAATGGASWK